MSLNNYKKSFNRRSFFLIMVVLIVFSIIDISVVKINDLIDKNFIPLQGKTILFSINSLLCLLLQFLLILFIRGSFKGNQPYETLKVRTICTTSSISLLILAVLIGILIFQQFYYNYYSPPVSIAIITISYGMAACLLIWLSLLFFTWYRSTQKVIVLLYFISMSVIAFNLIITATFAGSKLSFMPSLIGEYVGSSGDVSGGKSPILADLYNISTILAFVSMWIASAILLNYYREKLVNVIVFWIILTMPLGYFIITYFYQILSINLFFSILRDDPVAASIALGTFLTLSKPIGGLLFGMVFWNMSRKVSYERNIQNYMMISGWGLLLIFSSNQALTQVILPYPPFGLATVTILVTAAFLMLIGIYNSATLVSANNELRRSIYRHSLELRLLGAIGQGEIEKEIRKTVDQLTKDKYELEKEFQTPVELDESELQKYIESVIKEVRKSKTGDNR